MSKDDLIRVRCDTKEKAKWARVAKAGGYKSLSEWIVANNNRAAASITHEPVENIGAAVAKEPSKGGQKHKASLTKELKPLSKHFKPDFSPGALNVPVKPKGTTYGRSPAMDLLPDARKLKAKTDELLKDGITVPLVKVKKSKKERIKAIKQAKVAKDLEKGAKATTKPPKGRMFTESSTATTVPMKGKKPFWNGLKKK